MPGLSKVVFFTNEYPPRIHGGAGVVVDYLSRELSELVPLEVRCFGDQDVSEPNLRVKGYGPWSEAKLNTDPRFAGALDAVYRSLEMARDPWNQVLWCTPTPDMSSLQAFWQRSCGACRSR